MCINNHLAEGYVVSPRAAFSGVWEKTSIPQHPIYPCNTIFDAIYTSDIIFPPEGIHPYENEASRTAAGGWQALCSESASRSGGKCRGKMAPMGGINNGVVLTMGSGGCIRSKGGASGRLVATGEDVESVTAAATEYFF